MVIIHFRKTPDPDSDRISVDFSSDPPTLTLRVGPSDHQVGGDSKVPRNDFERRVLAASLVARPLVTCGSCKYLLDHGDSGSCLQCGKLPLDVIGASLANQLPDVWMQPYAGNLDSLIEHQSRLFRQHHPLPARRPSQLTE